MQRQNALLVLQGAGKQSLNNGSVALTQSAMQSTLQAQITALTLVIKDCNQNFKIYWAEIQR